MRKQSRGLRLGPDGTIRPRKQGTKKRKTAAEVRRERQAIARKKYPNVAKKLDRIKKLFEEADEKGGRYDYEEGLRETYILVRAWEAAGKGERRRADAAALAGILRRKGSNTFSVFLKCVSTRHRSTLSRWSLSLSKALKAGVTPLALTAWLAKQ
jgi:hypothetical protein